MIIPERTTQRGRVVPAFQIDDRFAGEVSNWRWSMQPNGYIRTTMNGKKVSLHRYIWLLHTGDWPKQEIDHINRDPLDNRVENLRDVSRSQNNKNQAPLCRLGRERTKRSGLPIGVKHDRRCRSRPYEARARSNGRLKHLGRFATPEEASRAYQEAVRSLKGTNA